MQYTGCYHHDYRSTKFTSPVIVKDAGERRSWALQICAQAGMRLTPIRRRILAFLAEQRVPVSLETVTQAEGIRGACNAATAYRTLMLLLELEVIRQVGLPHRISYFILNVPGQNSHFLICRCCGLIHELSVSESLAKMEREAAVDRGYTKLFHELVFFGICPACQQHPPGVVCVKVQPRLRKDAPIKFGLRDVVSRNVEFRV